MCPSTYDADTVTVNSIFLEECPAYARGCSDDYDSFLVHCSLFAYFRLRSYKKLQKKNLGNARKSGAEDESLKLLSEFKCLLFDFTVESDVFKISVVYFSFFAAPKYDYSEIICIFAPENKKITIMTQILVTLNEDATTVHVRKAIEMLRGVVSTTVFKTKDESNKKTLRQQAYVKESLKRAFDEMKQARREGRKLQSADDFIKELEAEESV